MLNDIMDFANFMISGEALGVFIALLFIFFVLRLLFGAAEK